LYSYTYDENTGGVLLNSSPTGFSREPRPVYAGELDVLGFSKYWRYDKQTEFPYMWAEANTYWYRGRMVAKLKGGSIHTAPEIVIPKNDGGKPVSPEPNGSALRPMDIPTMVQANQVMLEIIEETTVKKIVAVYKKYKEKVDFFHVAFSGGKDSTVLLDLVKKALPKGSFKVVFGDTGMEFPDTYDVIKKMRQNCEKEGIPFYEAKSHLEPAQSWMLFGPPSRTLRWCCSVHKSTPQTLKLREIAKGMKEKEDQRSDYTGLAFVGVRAQESARRSKYEYESYGKKQKGQYSHNSILEWTSAEVWLYIYANDLIINRAYKMGSARVGCLCCPMGGGKAGYIEYRNYSKEMDWYLSCIQDSNARTSVSPEKYVAEGGWNARKNGLFLMDNKKTYSETTKDGEIKIDVIAPKTDWKEWIKTLGDLVENGNQYTVLFRGQSFRFTCKPKNNGLDGYTVRLPERYAKESPIFGKLFRYTFRKAAYCVSCGTCQAICKHGCISFDGELKIENCRHCMDCYSMTAGCLAYDSLKIPKDGREKMKSINCFSNHAPKTEWLSDFFERGRDFLEENTLGPVQEVKFKRFLKDAGLINKNELTYLAKLGTTLKWESDPFLGLMLMNLAAENPQFQWYIREMEIGRAYQRSELKDMLTTIGQSKNNISSILSSYKRIATTPFGTTLHFSCVTEEDEFVRTKCTVSDPRVVLYGLFRFAEKCNDYKEFTLATLLNDSMDRNGISPSRIFGLQRKVITPILIGLTAKYPEYITSSFTHDLEKITLAGDKTSADVLMLFGKEEADV